MTATERPTDDDVSREQPPNHIQRRLRSRTHAREAIETLAPIYSRGVPTAAIVALVSHEQGDDWDFISDSHALRDALDHMERGGHIYQPTEDRWKVAHA